jgi:hypothetical protein
MDMGIPISVLVVIQSVDGLGGAPRVEGAEIDAVHAASRAVTLPAIADKQPAVLGTAGNRRTRRRDDHQTRHRQYAIAQRAGHHKPAMVKADVNRHGEFDRLVVLLFRDELVHEPTQLSLNQSQVRHQDVEIVRDVGVDRPACELVESLEQVEPIAEARRARIKLREGDEELSLLGAHAVLARTRRLGSPGSSDQGQRPSSREDRHPAEVAVATDMGIPISELATVVPQRMERGRLIVATSPRRSDSSWQRRAHAALLWRGSSPK